MIPPKPKTHLRQQINDKNLMQYKDKITDFFSARNISIVEEYMSGTSMAELGRKYNITPQRIRIILYNYIRYCYIYKRQQTKDIVK